MLENGDILCYADRAVPEIRLCEVMCAPNAGLAVFAHHESAAHVLFSPVLGESPG